MDHGRSMRPTHVRPPAAPPYQGVELHLLLNDDGVITEGEVIAQDQLPAGALIAWVFSRLLLLMGFIGLAVWLKGRRRRRVHADTNMY